MNKLLTLFLALPLASLAQTTWPVQVGGSTVGGTLPFYNPQQLTITVGDIVQWTNVSGTHNVNGSLALFPANPEGFSSGNPQGGNWTFSKTFTIPGVYTYHCTQQGHSATQFGSITVQSTTTVWETPNPDAAVSIFPVPTNGFLTVDLGGLTLRDLEIVALDGRRVMQVALNGRDRLEIATHVLPPGHYVLRMTDTDGRVVARPFLHN